MQRTVTQTQEEKQEKTGVLEDTSKAVASKQLTYDLPSLQRVERSVKLVVNPRNDEYHSEPKEMRIIRKKLGSEISVVDGKATTSYIRGLTREQEMLYLPRVLGVHPTDNEWLERLDAFWKDFTVIVDGELSLNASATIRNISFRDGETVTQIEVEEPDNIFDYTKYKFAMQSSKVAKTALEKSNASNYDIFLVDMSEEKKVSMAKFEIEQEADIKYASLLSGNETTTNEKIDWLIDKMKEPMDNFTSANRQEKLMALKKIKEKNPITFSQEFDNKNLQWEALAFKLIQNKIVSVEGTLHIFNGDNLGTYREFVECLKDQTKTNLTLRLREQLKLATQQKIK